MQPAQASTCSNIKLSVPCASIQGKGSRNLTVSWQGVSIGVEPVQNNSRVFKR